MLYYWGEDAAEDDRRYEAEEAARWDAEEEARWAAEDFGPTDDEEDEA
jgi:hypothetical protein